MTITIIILLSWEWGQSMTSAFWATTNVEVSTDTCFLNDWCFFFFFWLCNQGQNNNSQPQFPHLKMALIISTSLMIIKIKWNNKSVGVVKSTLIWTISCSLDRMKGILKECNYLQIDPAACCMGFWAFLLLLSPGAQGKISVPNGLS